MFIYPLIVKRQLTQYFSFLMVYANRLYVGYSIFVVNTPVSRVGPILPMKLYNILDKIYVKILKDCKFSFPEF